MKGILDSENDLGEELLKIYELMYVSCGPQNWWPAESPWEMLVGAILTQNTAWKNVELAISGLKRLDLLDVKKMFGAGTEELQAAIRPAGYFRQKADRLLGIAELVMTDYDGNVDVFLDGEPEAVRKRLLSIKGIGPETADSVLLYAGGKATFVIDAYTKRIFSRLGFFDPEISYEVARSFFMDNVVPDVQLFNEYHALIVVCAKDFCLAKRPRCEGCPLSKLCRKLIN